MIAKRAVTPVDWATVDYSLVHLSARSVELLLRGVRYKYPGTDYPVLVITPFHHPDRRWRCDGYFTKLNTSFCGLMHREGNLLSAQEIRALFDGHRFVRSRVGSVLVRLPTCPVCSAALDKLMEEKGDLFRRGASE